MKRLALILLLMQSTISFANTDDSDAVELYKAILPGIYTGDNCELRIHTEWFGDYYTRFLFVRNGETMDVETFHVGKIVQNLSNQNGNRVLFVMKDEIGSDGEDKYVNFTMNMELGAEELEISNVSYRYYSHTLFGIPTGVGRFNCKNMVRTGDAEDITLDTTYDYY